jgi:hypothetical protein
MRKSLFWDKAILPQRWYIGWSNFVGYVDNRGLIVGSVDNRKLESSGESGDEEWA